LTTGVFFSTKKDELQEVFAETIKNVTKTNADLRRNGMRRLAAFERLCFFGSKYDTMKRIKGEG